MPYTNAIFRIDPVNGSDTALPTLNPVSIAWNSGSGKMRCTYTNHGLVTGQIVTVSGAASALNNQWKITVIDANNFDLDYSPNTTSSTSATVAPFRGATWSTAAKTWNGINRHQAGDEFRWAKSTIQDSGVSTTWTKWSTTVPHNGLAALVQAADAVTGWTAATNITLGTNSTRRIGSASLTITPAAAFTTGKVAHFTFSSTQDFSSFTFLNFWLSTTTGTLADNTYRFAFCSDSSGNTIVKSYAIDRGIGTPLEAFVFEDSSGFGNNINSIAIYADVDPGTTPIRINNIFVSNHVNLRTFIGPSNNVKFLLNGVSGSDFVLGSEQAGTALPFPYTTTTSNIFYVNPVVITRNGNTDNLGALDNAASVDTSNFSTSYNITDEPEVGVTRFIGGYNTSTDSEDGLTYFFPSFFNGGTQAIFRLAGSESKLLKNLVFGRFQGYSSITTSARFHVVRYDNCTFAATLGTISPSTSAAKALEFYNSTFLDTPLYAFATRFTASDVHSVIKDSFILNPGDLGRGSTIIRDSTLAFPAGQHLLGITHWSLDQPRFVNVTFDFASSSSPTAQAVYPGIVNPQGLWEGNGSYAYRDQFRHVWWQTAEKPTGAPGAYRLQTTAGVGGTGDINAFTFQVAQIAAGTSQITVTAWVKNSHATRCRQGIRINDVLSTAGVSAQETLAAANTDWQQISLTFTPASAGIVVIEWVVYQYHIQNSVDCFLGPVTIS